MLVGAQRLLDLFPNRPGKRLVVQGNVKNLPAAIEAEGKCTVAALVTGDPGLYSLASLIIAHFGRQRCRVIPGVSSVQAAFAAIGHSWAGATIISAHKEDPPKDCFETCDKVCILGGRANLGAWLHENLPTRLHDAAIYVCENLTLPDEAVHQPLYEDLPAVKSDGRVIIIIIAAARRTHTS